MRYCAVATITSTWPSYGEAHQRLGELYADPEAWTRKVVLNIAASGQFSSDRTIAEYAKEIWDAKPCPIG